MKKKAIETITITPTIVLPLQDKLIAAVEKVLKENKSELTEKIQKVVNKSTKKIVKKIDKHIRKVLKKK